MKSLNGGETRPLTEASRLALADIANAARVRQSVNPGVADRLLRGGLVESKQLLSPFKTHRGGLVEHLVITTAGLDELRAWKGSKR